MSTASLIREARLRADVTQQELAARLGIPQQSVSRWESGKVQPSFEALNRVIGACELDLAVSLVRRDDSLDALLDQSLARTPAQRVSRLRERLAFKARMRDAQRMAAGV